MLLEPSGTKTVQGIAFSKQFVLFGEGLPKLIFYGSAGWLPGLACWAGWAGWVADVCWACWLLAVWLGCRMAAGRAADWLLAG